MTLGGFFGAVGFSGKKYYLVPPDRMDECVTSPGDKTWNEDGIGGPPGDIGWVRFQGGNNNVLNKFIDLHAEQGNPGGDLELLRQNEGCSGH